MTTVHGAAIAANGQNSFEIMFLGHILRPQTTDEQMCNHVRSGL